MEVKIFNYLPDDAQMIRQKVFVDEQGFKEEFDKIDDLADHFVLYDGSEPIATFRIFNGEKQGEYVLGRLAVIKEYRGKNIGSDILSEAEKIVLNKKGKSIVLHAQCRAKNFYAKSGYVEFGEIGEEEGLPHIWMKKQL